MPTPRSSWGWSAWNADHVLLRRIAPRGSDDGPGFTAHNLRIRAEELEAIDFDMTSLLRWVARQAPHSPPALSAEARPASESPSLAMLEPLAAPVAEVREIRRQTDRNFAAKVLDPLRQRLSPPGLAALLDAYLCSPSQKKPILIHALGSPASSAGPGPAPESEGESEGEAELRWELSVCDFYYTLFPYHCRRKLNFSTQVGELYGRHRDRDGPRIESPWLMMTTADAYIGWPTSANPSSSPFWIIDAASGSHVLPPSSKHSAQYRSYLDQSEKLLALRNAASRFRHPEELQGLTNSSKWQKALTQSPPRQEDVDLFVLLAPLCRDSYPAILEMARRCAAFAWAREALAPNALDQIAQAYLDALATQRLRLDPSHFATRWIEIRTDLQNLMQKAIAAPSPRTVARLARAAIREPALDVIQEALLERFARQLEMLWRGELLETAAPHWAELSAIADDNEDSASPLAEHFLGAIAGQLLASIQTGSSASSPASALEVGKMAFSASLRAPLPSAPAIAAEEIRKRHAMLGRLDQRGKTDWRRRFLSELIRRTTDGETRRALDAFAQTNPAVMLRGLGQDAIDALVEHLGNAASLASSYWSEPPELHDEELDRGLIAALERWESRSEAAPPPWLASYRDQGAEALIASLPRRRFHGLEALSAMTQAHGGLIRLARRTNAVEGSESGSESDQAFEHLAALTARVLINPPELDPEALNLEPILRPLLTSAAEFALTFADRSRFWDAVARRVKAWSLSDPPRIASVLQSLGIDSDEADWRQAQLGRDELDGGSGSDSDADRSASETRTKANLLLQRPSLASPPRLASEFQRWFAGQIDQAVWEELANRLTTDCSGPNQAGEIDLWFDPKSGRASLLQGLANHVRLQTVGERLAQRLGEQDAVFSISQLLTHYPHREIGHPCTRRLAGILRQRVQEWSTIEDSDATEEYANSAFKLSRVFLRIARDLSPDLTIKYWGELGRAFPMIDESTLRHYFPYAFELGCMMEDQFQTPGDQIWPPFFAPLSRMADADESRSIFVRAAESLFAAPDWRARQVPNAKRIADIASHGSLSTWLHNAKSFKDDPSSPLARALGQPPSTFHPDPESESLLTALQAARCRGQVIAALYAPQRMKTAASIYYRLGLSADQSSWDSKITAWALAGYLLIDGNIPLVAEKRAKELLESDFRKIFSSHFKGDRIVLLDTLWTVLESLLVTNKIPAETTEEIVARFRKVKPSFW